MRRIKKLIYGLLLFYIMIGSALYFLQEKLIFRPTILTQDYVYDFQYPFSELFLESDDGAIINAIHFKAQNPKGVILYFHGNAGDLSRWGEVTSFFVAKQYDVFVMEVLLLFRKMRRRCRHIEVATACDTGAFSQRRCSITNTCDACDCMRHRTARNCIGHHELIIVSRFGRRKSILEFGE